MKLWKNIRLTGLLVGFFSLSTLAFGQISNVTNAGQLLRVKGYENVEGTPFYCPEPKTGTVVMVNGTVYENVWLNYDGYQNTLRYLQNGNEMVATTDLIQEFTINGSCHNSATEVVFRKGFSIEGEEDNVFYMVLHDGPKLKFVKKFAVKKQSLPVPGTNGAQNYSKFFPSETYYFIDKDGNSKKIRKLKEKTVLKALNTGRKEAQEYLKQSNLDLSDERAIYNFFAYYEAYILESSK